MSTWKKLMAALVVACAALAVPITATAMNTGEEEPTECPHRSTNEVSVPAGLPADVTIHCVHVGGGDVYGATEARAPITLTRFYPDTLRVRQGDIVEFRPAPAWAGTLHGPAFVEDADVKSHPVPLPVPAKDLVRTDEMPRPGLEHGRTLAFHHDLATGSGTRGAFKEGSDPHASSRPGCGLKTGSRSNGIPPQLPCVLDAGSIAGKDRVIHDLNELFLAVGRPQPFWVKVDLGPGLYRFHCTYHPEMVGQIEVVKPGRSIPTQDEVIAQAKVDATADMAEARALYDRLNKASWRQEGDRRIWRVTTGATTDSGRAAINGYMPAGLKVKRGDGVEFVVGRPDAPTPAGRGGEAQTVTFPGKAVGGFFLNGCTYSKCDGTPWIDGDIDEPQRYESTLGDRAVPHGLTLPAFPWGCDYDEMAGGEPALPTWAPSAGCPASDNDRTDSDGNGYFEFVFGENTVAAQRAPGDAVVTDGTLHNSGWIVPSRYGWPNRPDDQHWNGEPWPTKFEATFPSEGTFTYGCLLHPDVMTGAITVEPR